MIVIMMIIASYTDDDDRHHDNDCMQARVLSCTPAAAAPIENRIILSVGAAAAVIFPGDILLMGAAVAGADKGTMGLGFSNCTNLILEDGLTMHFGHHIKRRKRRVAV